MKTKITSLSFGWTLLVSIATSHRSGLSRGLKFSELPLEEHSEEHRVLGTLESLSFLLKTQLAGRPEVATWSTLELTGAFLSMGLMTNFLSLKEMFLISLQGKPIFGVNLRL